MALYVYNSATGILVSWCPSDTDSTASASTLAAKGLVLVKGLAPLDATHAWDPATHSVVVVTAPVAPKLIGTGKWTLRFTPQEFAAIIASTDIVVNQFVFALKHTIEIDLSDPVISQGVNYLVSVNLLAADRVAIIMASA